MRTSLDCNNKILIDNVGTARVEGKAPSQSTNSTQTSLQPKRSWLQPLWDCLSGLWNWIKKNIFRIKEEVLVKGKGNILFVGNPIEVLSTREDLDFFIRFKNENPDGFLRSIVDKFLQNPEKFIQDVEALPSFSSDTQGAPIVVFLQRQCILWNKYEITEILNHDLVQELYSNCNGNQKQAIERFVTEINQEYSTWDKQKPIVQMHTDKIYQEAFGTAPSDTPSIVDTPD